MLSQHRECSMSLYGVGLALKNFLLNPKYGSILIY